MAILKVEQVQGKVNTGRNPGSSRLALPLSIANQQAQGFKAFSDLSHSSVDHSWIFAVNPIHWPSLSAQDFLIAIRARIMMNIIEISTQCGRSMPGKFCLACNTLKPCCKVRRRGCGRRGVVEVLAICGSILRSFERT